MIDTVTIHPMFEECVSQTASSRFNITTPFVRDGFLCATNGPICVRRPTTAEDTKGGKFPSFAALPWRPDFYEPEPTALPEFEAPTIQSCEACNGTGSAMDKQCDECDGEGSLTCDLGHEHDCDECDGRGVTPRTTDDPRTPCEECDGTGQCPADQISVAVGNVLLGNGYLDILRRHNAKIFLPRDSKKTPMIRFAVEPDIEGLLCVRSS